MLNVVIHFNRKLILRSITILFDKNFSKNRSRVRTMTKIGKGKKIGDGKKLRKGRKLEKVEKLGFELH